MEKNKAKDTFFSKKRSLNCRGKLISLESPRVMGILNITPDSFYDGGKFLEPAEAVERTGKMLQDGAAFIDIGAASSRPGAGKISPDEELQRLHPVLEAIRKAFPQAVLSVDTCQSSVVKQVVESYDVDIVNDISAGEADPEMIPLMAKLNRPYIIMHMQGDPSNMQENPTYENVTDDILQYFSGKLHILHRKGVNDVLVDPGFGFGKTVDHNYELLSHIYAFQMLEVPLVAGISRKSMIQKLLDTDAEGSLNGTTAAHMLLLERGVDIIRVHDVPEAVQTVKIFMETRKY